MKRTKKIITFISLLLVLIMFLPEFVQAKDISSRSELTSGPNVGNRIYLGNGRNDGTVSMFKESDHLYCVQHRADTEDAWYRVDAYVEINGTNATAYTGKTGKTVKTSNSSVNTVLAYVCGEQNYYKGYNNSYTNDGVRMRAIHKYLQTWYNTVGFSKLGIDRKWNDSGFSLDNHWRVKDRALKLISDGQNYAKNTNSNAPKIDKNSTTKDIEQISETAYGPFKIKYSGIIESIVAKDSSGNAISNITFSTDKDGKKTVKAANIKSNENYYIHSNSGKKINTVSIKLKDSEVLSAKIWFLERNDGARSQRLITVDTGKTKAKGETYVMNIIPLTTIKGYVWIDIPRTKLNTWDSLYNNGEETRVAGVTVKLVNKNSGKVEETKKTNASGVYTFDKKIIASKLKNYYVEFDYNGVKVSDKDISKYIPVAFNSTDINKIDKAGSRALMDSVAEEDTNLSGKASTYKGKDAEKGKIYGLDYNGNLYKKLLEGDVLNNINLGIKEIPQTDYSVNEALENVEIGMKGYKYKYIYGKKGDKQKVAAPKVNWQHERIISAYSTDFYPSDIAYDVKNSTEELTTKVTYRIDITNTTNYNIEDLYKEDKLVITSLINNYDTNRYTLVEDANWTKKDGKEGTAVYKGNAYNGVDKDKTVSVEIVFNVKHDALVDILNHPNGIIENNPTKTIAVGYHKYLRRDYSWENNIQKDNQPHKTSKYERDSDAPYLIFKLGEERVLSGTVFEDGVVTTDGQVLGSGTFDEKENIVRDVVVELLDVKEGENDFTKLQVSGLYGVLDNKAISRPAQVKTDENGKYILNGIVPGYYLIRFTYGDGTQKIYNTKGEEVNTLTAKDFKSTIITNDVIKQALRGGTNYEWYKGLDTLNPSIAIDSLSTRAAVNAGTQNSIMAGSAKINIRIENTEKDEADIQVSENGEQVSLPSNKFNGLNFGIIKQPKQMARLAKVITNIKVENAQNNFGFSGNPETDFLKGVSDLDNTKNGGSKYLRAELEDQYISGATLELTYGISVTNISDVNYYNNDYYWYGEADPNKEVTLNITKITDYLDETLEYKAEQSDKRIEVSSNVDTEGRTILNLNLGEKEEDRILYTENNKARSKNKKTSDTFALVAGRILSKQEDDMEYLNRVEITNEDIDNSTDPDDPTDNDKDEEIKSPEEPNPSEAVATVTPPTGADRQEIILYTIAGIIALAVLSAGVIMIKKIVKK